MKNMQIFLIITLIFFSYENKEKNDERLLPLACERIVENFKRFGNLDKLDGAISNLFLLGIIDEYTESISKWLLSYQFQQNNLDFYRIIWEEKENYFRTVRYEYVTEEIFRETIKNYL